VIDHRAHDPLTCPCCRSAAERARATAEKEALDAGAIAAVDVENRELRRLLGVALDVLRLPGHVMNGPEWERAIVLAGRYCAPFWDGPPNHDDCGDCGQPR